MVLGLAGALFAGPSCSSDEDGGSAGKGGTGGKGGSRGSGGTGGAEAGKMYLHIAQPPLYGVRKGKKMLYMKDQAALDRFLIENGIEGLTVQLSRGPALSGTPLFNLTTRLRAFRAILAKVEARPDECNRKDAKAGRVARAKPREVRLGEFGSTAEIFLFTRPTKRGFIACVWGPSGEVKSCVRVL